MFYRAETDNIQIQALPYYWKELRVDSYRSAQPFFGCLDCLDEFEEEYSIHCPEWCVTLRVEPAQSQTVSTCTDLSRIHSTGEGSVHSKADLVSRNHVKDGSQDADAYELAKQNYHRYLVDFLQWFAKHRALRECALVPVATVGRVQLSEGTCLLTHGRFQYSELMKYG